jgi:hypothetical protein
MTCSHCRLIGPIMALLLVPILASPWLAFAQDDGSQEAALTLARLRIELWPEFDQPSVLVLYSGEVAGASAEVTLTFAMPEGATFNAAAYTDPETGDLLQAQSSIDGGAVTMTSPNGTFHVEFYDPSFDTSAAERSYSYAWGGEYAVTTLEWAAQQPPTAQDFTTDPAGILITGDLGLQYTQTTVTDLAAGDTSSFSFTYTKADSALTADLLPSPGAAQEDSTAPEDSQPQGTINTTTVLITMLVLAGVGLIGGGLYLYNRSREEQEASPSPYSPPSRRRGRTKGRARSAPPGEAPRFCTNCGTPVADPSDRFCRNCGASLRR